MQNIKIIGVYPIKAKQPVHMIEMIIEDSKGTLDLCTITQETEGKSIDSWQVPYMEHILNEQGTEILADDYEATLHPELWQGNVRMIFFFHYLNLNKPLLTPWGEIELPKVTEKPERLKIDYEEVD